VHLPARAQPAAAATRSCSRAFDLHQRDNATGPVTSHARPAPSPARWMRTSSGDNRRHP
jgi:hypothetical protein